MTEEYEEQEEQPKGRWRKPKRNWGFWVLIIGFIVYLITWYVIKPMLESGG